MLYRVIWLGSINIYDGTLWHSENKARKAIREALLCENDYFNDIEKCNLEDQYERDIEDWGDMTYEEWVETTMKNDLYFEEVKIEDEED